MHGNDIDVEQQMSFTVLEYNGPHNPGFLVESIAPDNVEDPDQANPPFNKTTPVSINRIVDLLHKAKSPNLVISVHGFNSPRADAVRRFAKEFASVDADKAITSDTVCVGYRWPSEAMGSPWRSFLAAAPHFLLGLMIVGVLSLLFFMLFSYLSNSFPILAAYPWLRPAALTLAALSLAVVFTLFLLRAIVYFRDGYRATQYGVPDLVDVIRKIDEALYLRTGSADNIVGLSFIGHSMGGYVVTNTVRILSDVFSSASLSQNADDPTIRHIGRKFHLENLVLVSPDIPAEALMPNSANFLQSSLRRFEEVYLFSNEGDEVLRLIAVTANYFSFPIRNREFGYRLGNVGAVGLSYTLTPKGLWTLKELRLGFRTIAALSTALRAADTPKHPANDFGYFDCTDCVDGNGNGVLTSASRDVPFNRSWVSHLWLLFRYLRHDPDVHSGYFDFEPLASLIYRLACIGYTETEQATSCGISRLCGQLQIKALGRSAIIPDDAI